MRRRAGAPGPGVVEAVLAVFAHEVRTPLTGILAVSDLLATSDLDARDRRWVDTIKAGAEHLAGSRHAVRRCREQPRLGHRPAPGLLRSARAGASRRGFAGRPRGGQGAAILDQHRRETAGLCRGRCGAAARRAGEPDRQRGQVHRSGQRRPEGVSGAGAERQGRRRLRGVGQRHRAHARRDQAAVPAVHPGQCRHRRAVRRRRPRAVVGAPDRACDGRRRHRDAARERRHHLHADGDADARHARDQAAARRYRP